MILVDTHALIWFMFDDSQLQAITENLHIVSKDGIIPQYGIKTIW